MRSLSSRPCFNRSVAPNARPPKMAAKHSRHIARMTSACSKVVRSLGCFKTSMMERLSKSPSVPAIDPRRDARSSSSTGTLSWSSGARSESVDGRGSAISATMRPSELRRRQPFLHLRPILSVSTLRTCIRDTRTWFATCRKSCDFLVGGPGNSSAQRKKKENGCPRSCSWKAALTKNAGEGISSSDVASYDCSVRRPRRSKLPFFQVSRSMEIWKLGRF